MRLSAIESDPGYQTWGRLSFPQRCGVVIHLDGKPIDPTLHSPVTADEEEGFIEVMLFNPPDTRGQRYLQVADGKVVKQTLRGVVKIEVPAA